MSAFICSPVHINTIVSWAVENHGILPNLDPAAWAAELYSENVRSVNHRYSERTKRTGFVYVPVPTRGMDPVQVLKLIHCLEYQSCEHKGWERSEARRFLRYVSDRAAMELPGYEAAKWSI